VIVGAVWTVTTAVAEATVVAQAAVAGDTATFEAWQVFAEGMSTGFAFLGLAVAVIAANEAQSTERATPKWAAWIGTVVGITAFLGFAAGAWAGIDAGGLVFVVSAIVMLLWTLWFGVALLRVEPITQTQSEESPA
jgi:hypothetical protein